MRVTVPGDVDLEVRTGTAASRIAQAAGLSELWCGRVRLDDDHPAGVPPLVHGARLSARPEPERCAPPGASGPTLRVIAGPDAGGSVTVGPRGVVVGRSDECDLRLADPAVSQWHALVCPTGRVRDAGSSNGTRGARRLARGQPLRLGRSVVVLDLPSSMADAPPQERPRPAWGTLAAGGAAGVIIAVATGRWYLALLGIAAPAAMLVPALVRRLRPTHASSGAEPWRPPEGPVAVVGDDRWARGYVRAVAVERGRAPAGEAWAEPWMRWLGEPSAGDRMVHVPRGATAPTWCRTTVAVGPHGRVERTPDGESALPPLAMTAVTADARARAAAAARGDTTLPAALRWADLPSPTQERARGAPRRLTVTLGCTATATLQLDLDADGPHLLIAGTTGSGKSVTLETLVAALALAHPPADLEIALVDFKAGAGLRSCLTLPRVCGVLTDLDGALATRVIDALSAELAARKRAVAERGLASIAEWERRGDAPARLLVVIDEYQEIVTRHPSFLPDLARLAAQGRSLGLHLVLATQRPAGAVTPEVRANVSTTIALRVAGAAESRDLVGTPEAADLPPGIPGRALISRAGAVEMAQIAAPIADPSPAVSRVGAPAPPGRSLAHVAASRWRRAAPARALWLPPLPARWEPAPGDQVRLALADWPRERLQREVVWRPTDGPAVIVGPARSGRTSALSSLAQQARAVGMRPVWLPSDPREAARTVHLVGRASDALLVVDDAERALARLGQADDGAAADALLARLALRAPTAVACATHAPIRLAAAAAITAVIPGHDPGAAAPWGAPRDRALSSSHPGRAWLSIGGAWVEGQLCHGDHHPAERWVRSLPDHVESGWAVGGDRASTLTAPRGRVAVVGAAGAARDAVAASLPHATVTCHDAPHLVPPVDAVLLLDPSPRALRMLAPRGWQGIAEPVPRDGRCALIVDAVATAVQLRAR
ncbi:FtsK/SpoIIIE domain-containing protein [Demequina activiva]|uniref:FtsK/SpoIIIE family protein n=1 Tax=Demequina activiva TaxID=1582364 RepID=A0A919UHF5_9MICO|nr:FtsK/SpoIIIE domain-containing protein [Demequina activiva]GIG55374.1 hypothetical protein Dac01nite_21260 [Demequina activiva]